MIDNDYREVDTDEKDEAVSEKNETESAEELAPRVAIRFDDGPH